MFICLCLLWQYPQTLYADEYFRVYYGKLSWEDEKAHLNNYAFRLLNSPEMIGYMGFFVGKKETYKNVQSRMNRAKNYLQSRFKIPKSRIVIIYAGRDEETKVILHLVPKDKPRPTF